jgi:hypothetical protein
MGSAEAFAKRSSRFRGRAWISVDDYQMLRLQTDLVPPIYS